MTVKESYQSAYARKNQAISAQYKTKKAALTSKKKRIEEESGEKLRAAYGEYMRAAAVADQQNRSAGRFGGAAENQKAGLAAAHTGEREQLRSKESAEVAAVESQLKTAAADKDKKLSDNAAALQQKLDAIALKEESAAQKSGKSVKSVKSVKSGSSGKVSKSQAITLMKMGIYDTSFAGLLGISDKDVREYVEAVKKGKKKTSTSESETDTRLPGTYKPPLE